MQRTIGQCFQDNHSTAQYEQYLKDSSISEEAVNVWLEKVVTWSSVNATFTISQTLEQREKLMNFLNELHILLHQVDDINFLLNKIPSLGQLLGRLCGNVIILSTQHLYILLMKCVLKFAVENPQTPVENKAKIWALSQLRSTVSYTRQEIPNRIVELTGFKPNDFNNRCLKEVLARVNNYLDVPLRKWDTTCNCYVPVIHKELFPTDALELCASLLHLEEFNAVTERILKRLSLHNHKNGEVKKFYEAVTKSQKNPYDYGCSPAQLSYKSKVCLWTTYLPSFEQEVLNLIKASCFPEEPRIVPFDELNKIVNLRDMPLACAEHFNLWKVTIAILGSFCNQTQGNDNIKRLISVFSESVQDQIKKYLVDPSPTVLQLYPDRLRHLVSIMNFSPACNHMHSVLSALDNCFGASLEVLHESVFFILIQFPQWYHVALEIVCSTVHRTEKDLLKHLCIYHNPNSEKTLQKWLNQLEAIFMNKYPSLITGDDSILKESVTEILSNLDFSYTVKTIVCQIVLIKMFKNVASIDDIYSFLTLASSGVPNHSYMDSFVYFIEDHQRHLKTLNVEHVSIFLKKVMVLRS